MIHDINDFENGPPTEFEFRTHPYFLAAEKAYSATARSGKMSDITRKTRFSKAEKDAHREAMDLHRQAAQEAQKAGYGEEEAYHDRMADMHGRTLKEETILEDGMGAVAANVTGDSKDMSMPPTAKQVMKDPMRRAKLFRVSGKTFRNFAPGRAKWDRWSNYLDKNVQEENELYQYATQNPDHAVIIEDADTGALRVVRRVDEE